MYSKTIRSPVHPGKSLLSFIMFKTLSKAIQGHVVANS